MIKRVLVNDESWLVTLGPMGGMTVTSNLTGRSRKASKPEAAYVQSVIDYLEANGEPIAPDNENLVDLLHECAEAVINPGGVGWHVFFNEMSPDEMGAAILNDSL